MAPRLPPSLRPDRLAPLKAADVAPVAAALGMVLGTGRRWSPCPACGKERGGRGDERRGPVAMYDGGRRWKCHAGGCEAGGDALALAAWKLTGKPQPGRGDSDGWRDLLALLEGAGLVAPAGLEFSPVYRPPVPPRPRPAPEPAPRLDPGEVSALWASGWPVTVEDRARRWLLARDLDPLSVAALDLARGLPPGGAFPAWAGIGRASGGGGWPTVRPVQAPDGRTVPAGWSLVLPCYDPAGSLVALRGRWTGAAWSEAADRWIELVADPKERSPAGPGACRGTVYADPVGRWLLARGPEARRGDLAGEEGDPLWDGRVLLVEGGPGWLRYATWRGRVHREDDGAWRGPQDGPAFTDAVLGVWQGAWPADREGEALAARVRSADLVTVATDDDEGGDKIAGPILATLDACGVNAARANKQRVNHG